MMELKVWVDGLQRVVCGATLDTTCQDVVIALAHAMGRTGRFTLVEKWRDNDRPLTPTECPLRVLHKWGEYAAEVRFVLCQADTDTDHHPRSSNKNHLGTSQDKLANVNNNKKSGSLTDRPWFPPHHRNFAPHPQMQALLTGGGGTSSGGDVNVKRSLTFSGAHGNGPPSAPPGAWLNSSAPTSKFRKTHLGPVPNGDVKRPLAGTTLQQQQQQQQHPLPPAQSFQRPAARTEDAGRAGGRGAQLPPTDQQQTSQQHPIPSPRRRHSPLPPPQSRDPLRNNNSALPQVPTSSLSLPSDHDDHHLRHPHPHGVSTHPQPHPQSRTAPSSQPPASHPQPSSTSQGVQPHSHSHQTQPHPYPQPQQHSHAPPHPPSSSQGGTQSQHPHPSSAHPQSHPPQKQTHPEGAQESPYPHPQPPPPTHHHHHHQPHHRHESDFQPHPQHHSSHSHQHHHQQQHQQEQPKDEQQVQGQKLRTHSLVPSHPNHHSRPHIVRAPSPLAPPLPSSPPPLHANPELLTPERVSLSSPVLGSPGHSGEASIELEEYDLERNFPETHRDSSSRVSGGGGGGGGISGGGVGGSDLGPTVSLEYRLEDGVGSGSGGQGHLMEGEHAKLLRLVNMQQERLKTQESQISLVNTDITALEEQEKEYEDKLQAIMEELLLHENRQRDLEPQLQELEKVEWENVLDGEKKCEVDLTLKIASCKAQILEHEHKLEDVKKKEADLLDELKAEEEKITQERERLKAEEAHARDEENKTREEITGLQSEFTELQKRAAELGTSLSSVNEELQAEEQELEKKCQELESLEEQLKDENLKDFAAHPVAKEEDLFQSKTNSGEAIIKILEGRLSPRPGSVSSKALENPSSPPFISALSAKNQSGVWV